MIFQLLFYFSIVMTLCGDCERELSCHEANYERELEADVVGRLNALLEVCSVTLTGTLVIVGFLFIRRKDLK